MFADSLTFLIYSAVTVGAVLYQLFIFEVTSHVNQPVSSTVIFLMRLPQAGAVFHVTVLYVYVSETLYSPISGADAPV